MSSEIVQQTLSSAELAYLLQMLAAQTVIGLDPAPLFAADQDARKAQLEQGLAELKLSGRLQPKEHDSWALDVNVAAMAVAVADPEIVISVTRIETPQSERMVNYYLAASFVVELAVTEENAYRLTGLPELDLIAVRVGQALGLPLEAPTTTPKTMSLSTAQFEVIAQSSHTDGAREKSPDADAASVAAASLINTGRRQAKIECWRVVAQQIIGVFDMALLAHNGQQWFVHYPVDTVEQVIIAQATTLHLTALLRSVVAELLELRETT